MIFAENNKILFATFVFRQNGSLQHIQGKYEYHGFVENKTYLNGQEKSLEIVYGCGKHGKHGMSFLKGRHEVNRQCFFLARQVTLHVKAAPV